jgi:hypothetical protein
MYIRTTNRCQFSIEALECVILASVQARGIAIVYTAR